MSLSIRPLLGTALCCLLNASPALAWAAEPKASPAIAAAPAETMILRVTLNTENKGDLFVGRTPDNDFLLKPEDLRAIGFKAPAGSAVLLDGEPHLSLRAMRGVHFVFEEKALVLHITAEPQLLPNQMLAQQTQKRIQGEIPKNHSLFVNYALNYAGSASGAASKTGFASELGWHFGDYLFLANGSTVQTGNEAQRFVRLMSSLTRDDRESLQRTVIGDFYTPSREFSTGVNLGGISVSRRYGLNPYFTPFPMQNISGNAALPSELEVYLDGQRIRSEKIKPGEFELRDLLAYGGARNIQLVLRDSFGRVQQLDYSFYFTDQPLRQGLQEYSYNLGALRRDYGVQSQHYGPMAYSLFHRYGVNDALTLGLRAEGTGRFYSAGPLATVVLGQAGVVNLALAVSAFGADRGASALMNYNYQSRQWSLGVALRRDWGNYASLGDPPAISNRQSEGSLSASYFLPGRGSLSFSHSAVSIRDRPAASTLLENRRISTLGYSTSLVSGRVSLQASVSRIHAPQSRLEAYVGLLFFFDRDFSLAARHLRGKDGSSESVELTKNQPIGEGLGYVLSAERASAQPQLNARVQYNAPFALLQGDFSHSQGSSYHASVAGGMAYVDGEIALGRPVNESFGIVKVGQLPGVAVSVNNQLIGKTNAQGKLFIPTLTPYFDNDVSIAAESVPIDYAIPATSKKISPSLRSGAVIDFGLTKIQAFSGTLKNQAGEAVAYQTVSFSADGKTQTMQTGHGGEFYLENLKPGVYPAAASFKGQPCLFELTIAPSPETFVELGALVCHPAP